MLGISKKGKECYLRRRIQELTGTLKETSIMDARGKSKKAITGDIYEGDLYNRNLSYLQLGQFNYCLVIFQ